MFDTNLQSTASRRFQIEVMNTMRKTDATMYSVSSKHDRFREARLFLRSVHLKTSRQTGAANLPSRVPLDWRVTHPSAS